MPNDIGKAVHQVPSLVNRQLEISDSSELDLRRSFELIWANRNVVFAFIFATLLIGGLYMVVKAPVYKADGLVQVEEDAKSGAMKATLGELTPLLMGGTLETEGEIQILKSRMVLDKVIDKENLLIETKPRWFPIIGGAIARANKKLDHPASAPPGLGSFAWGGEKVEIPTFDVPEELYDKSFHLTVTDGGYFLENNRGEKIFDGKVGELMTGDSPKGEGQIKIFVQVLSARPGTDFKILRRPREEVLENFDKKLEIAEQGKQSGVIQITFTDKSQERVATIVNDIEDAYLRQNVERRSAEAQQSLEFLNQQLPELKDKVEAAQAKLNSYQLQHGTVDVTEETAGVLHESVDLESKRLELEQERQQALQRFTPQHPMVKSLDDSLKLVQGALEKTKSKIAKLPTTQQDVLGLLRDLDVATELYTAMLDTIQQLQVAKAGTIGTVRIVDHAFKPYNKSSPKAAVIFPIAFFLGVFLGCAYVITKRALLRGIDDPAEVERLFGLATYASIPYSNAQSRLTKAMGRTGVKNTILAISGKDSFVTEAFRSLRTSLHFALIDSPGKVIMISGPTPGLGKSFVSVNFAGVLADAGKKVLVFDLDLRRGHIHNYFGGDAKPGITDFLLDEADEASIIRSSELPGLDYIARGTIPPNPADLLLSERFSSLIRRLASKYDHVIIDSPPVLPVADAAIIGQLADCVLIVLKSAEHTSREVEETIKRFSTARIPLRGVVFNQVGAKVGSYGYGNYGYSYYGYDS